MKILKRHRLLFGTMLTVLIIICAISLNFPKNPLPQKGGNQTIYLTSDIHYISERINDHGTAFDKFISSGDGKQLDYITSIMDTFVDEISQKNPNILIISGDLTSNGEKASHEDLAKYLQNIEKLGTQVYVIPGNHDINNPWARRFKGDEQYLTDYISDRAFKKIYADFGYKEAISRDSTTLSYLAAPTDSLWLLMIDSNRYHDNIGLGTPRTDGVISQSTQDWMKQCYSLAKKKGADVIPVMHHNIVPHSVMLQSGFTLNNSEQIQDLLRRYNTNLVLSGHIHAQDISSKTNKSSGTIYDIASGSLPVNPHQYGVLQYDEQNGTIDYSTTILDVQGWAIRNNIQDKNLINFLKYSEDLLGLKTYEWTYDNLKNKTALPENQIKEIAETMELLNLRYFAGTEFKNKEDVIFSRGYELLTTSPDSLYKEYALNIISDMDIDDTHLFIKIRK
jgi:3',5'-cyclic AMP phosphodiesterase CpdA